MENHPIPQNVTGFQFKLIGDMTIKQFVYLATGSVAGWFFFSLPITAFIRFPISIFFVLTGISFAFLPLAGRPVDVMIANFIKSLLNPTQYIYRKSDQDSLLPNKATLVTTPSTNKQINPNLQTLPKIEPKKSEHQPDTIDLPTAKGLPVDELKKEKESESPQSPTSFDLHQKVLNLESQLQEVLAQKEQLAQQIIELQKKLNVQKQSSFVPTAISQKKPAQSISLGLPLGSDVPNIVTGTVKDPRGNPLPNILVEIKDKDGNPARAFKTNALGQFASATPLPNGVYAIGFEDPKNLNKFDEIELNVTGKTLMPIEARSIDAREELRKSLFGQKAN